MRVRHLHQHPSDGTPEPQEGDVVSSRCGYTGPQLGPVVEGDVFCGVCVESFLGDFNQTTKERNALVDIVKSVLVVLDDGVDTMREIVDGDDE